MKPETIYTANIYSQFTVIGCVTCATVIWQCLLQATTVHMTFNDTEEYSLRSITTFGCNICSPITIAHVHLPKCVLSTVKLFAVYVVHLYYVVKNVLKIDHKINYMNINIGFLTFCELIGYLLYSKVPGPWLSARKEKTSGM